MDDALWAFRTAYKNPFKVLHSRTSLGYGKAFSSLTQLVGAQSKLSVPSYAYKNFDSKQLAGILDGEDSRALSLSLFKEFHILCLHFGKNQYPNLID
ncbi:hypothetical protein Tco_1119973 [Tanacetum coccineum]